MDLARVTLEDKYRLERGQVYLSGVQALVRLPLLQHQRDLAAGLNTAGYVSGYRGSPLGGLDSAFQAAENFLKEAQVSFHPGVNEDLAATAVWGTQQLHLFPKPKFDGVFSMWYGKGPGVDRCGDVFKHANYAGTAKHGGVLLIAGDDHSAHSSAVAHQSEHSFSACGIPVLAPAGLQDYLDLGLHGWAMSRFSGCWVAMKVTSASAESSARVEIDPQRVRIELPGDFMLPPDGVNIRWPDAPLDQEWRMQEFKVYAALAYARANRLNHLIFGAAATSKPARLGIIACGKAYLDVRQALEELGIDERLAADIGLRLYKVGMPWPLEAAGVRQFAEGLEEILVVEEKRPIIEYQLREQLYNWHEKVRPRVVGKFAESDEWSLVSHHDVGGLHSHWLLPPTGELTPAIVARAIGARLANFHNSETIRQRLALLAERERALDRPQTLQRKPYFCSGCPHNLSTRVPQDSQALGGVGCHLMALGMERNTLTICQMGGEGVPWLGLAAHTGTQHIFANMGDGTYYHSGLLAIRAAIAAAVNITYKILYNDAVAMTGGQAVDGPLDVPQITRQLAAEGLRRIVVLADDPYKYPRTADFAPGVEIRRREELDRVQRELRETPGVTALIYDQTCAAEKRRRRKRGNFADPPRRIFINSLVCEGCGDCSVKSNCLSVVPVETEFGRKRAIDQSSCNKDYSCLAGFCPSLVSIEGGSLRKGKALLSNAVTGKMAGLPEPTLPDLAAPYGMLIAGIGGTGVVTIGALIGMAAHLEGKGVTVLDMTGLAQKGGAVLTHVRLAREQNQLHAVRIDNGAADCLLGCDMLVAVSALNKTFNGFTRAVVNTSQAITGDFVRHPELEYPFGVIQEQLRDALGEAGVEFVDASRLSTLLLGDAIMTNLFMLGYAWQKGLVPVSAAALLRAIELNGIAIDRNVQAFEWGRRAACDPNGIAELTGSAQAGLPSRNISSSLDEIIVRRHDYLVAYQDAAYARRYTTLVERVRQAERQALAGSTRLAEAVALNYFRLLACKDEYEVARLFGTAEFAASLNACFEGDFRVNFHFNLPLLGAIDPDSGEPRKYRFGPWMKPLLQILARGKFLRGTRLDPFGYAAERRQERELLQNYENDIELLLPNLCAENHATAIALAGYPEGIRGFGPVKMRSITTALAERNRLRAAWSAGLSGPAGKE